MNIWYVILIVAIVLVSLDKAITAINITLVKHNNPNADALSIEKNPLARLSFKYLGLIGGTIFYWIFSIGTFLFATWLFSFSRS